MARRAVILTQAEVRHLQSLLQDSVRSGEYYGDRRQYWNRHQRIVDKLTPPESLDGSGQQLVQRVHHDND